MLRYSTRAMNTDCLLILHVNGVDDEGAGSTALMRAVARVQEYERTFSRFRPDSGLSRLNEGPSDRVQVCAELAALLARALEYARLTGGVFDPLMLTDLEALGYDRTFEEVSSRGHAPYPVAARARTHWTMVQVDAARGVVNRPPGARIDLGGVAKGAAADAAMSELASFPGALIDLGGDIRAHGQPDDAVGWIVAVDEPAGPHVASLDHLKLRDGAVATSSVRRRQWARNGRTVHHIIDPRTGQEASSGVVQCTAIADTAEHADVAAKVGLILGVDSPLEHGEMSRALGLRGMAWVTADGGYQYTEGWRSYALGRQ
jgi:thiamine biosynthesis lipoprotein